MHAPMTMSLGGAIAPTVDRVVASSLGTVIATLCPTLLIIGLCSQGHERQAAAPNRLSAEDCFENNLSHSHSCDQFLFRVRNKRRLRSKSWRVTSVAKPENAFPGDFHAMIKHTALILSAATLSFGLALATAFADDTMKKDTMSKDSMSKDSMKKDSMSKDSMSEDTMSKDSMSKDSMKTDDMKKN